jgi:hypothetical protein
VRRLRQTWYYTLIIHEGWVLYQAWGLWGVSKSRLLPCSLDADGGGNP